MLIKVHNVFQILSFISHKLIQTQLSTNGNLYKQRAAILGLLKEIITLKSDVPDACEKVVSVFNKYFDSGDILKKNIFLFKESTTKVVNGQSSQLIDDGVKSSTSKIYSKEKNCSTCGKTFTRPQDLRRHLKSHDETSSFLCEECGKSYRSPDGLNYHKALNHSSLNLGSNEGNSSHPLKCPICSKDVLNEVQLKVHLKNSHQRATAKYTCTTCVKPKEFKRKDCFKKHLALHERAKAFSCLICAKSFSSRSNLQSHARTFHDTSAPLQCPTCSKKFHSKKRLGLHIPECMSRKFCSSCKFICQREEDMSEHIKKAHPADYAIQEVFGQNLEGLS